MPQQIVIEVSGGEGAFKGLAKSVVENIKAEALMEQACCSLSRLRRLRKETFDEELTVIWRK